jgi:hypothetical protein
VIRFSCDAPRVKPPGELREIVFQLCNFEYSLHD